MIQPQSEAEVAPVRAAIRRLDPLLDLIWNPRAKQHNHGRYDVYGNVMPVTFEGRWQVVRHETYERDTHALVYTLGADDPGEPYREVGMWLYDFLAKWDSAQAHCAAELDRVWAEHDKAEHAIGQMDEGFAEEAVERMYVAQGHAKRLYEGVGFGKGTKTTLTTSE